MKNRFVLTAALCLFAAVFAQASNQIIRTAEDLRKVAGAEGRYLVAAGVYEIEPPLFVRAELIGLGRPTIKAASSGELPPTSTWSALVRIKGKGSLRNFVIDADSKVGIALSVEAVSCKLHQCTFLYWLSKGVRVVHGGAPVESLDFRDLDFRSDRGDHVHLPIALQIDPRSKPIESLVIDGVTIPNGSMSRYKGKVGVGVKFATVITGTIRNLECPYRAVIAENNGLLRFERCGFGYSPPFEWYPDTGAIPGAQNDPPLTGESPPPPTGDRRTLGLAFSRLEFVEIYRLSRFRDNRYLPLSMVAPRSDDGPLLINSQE